MSHQVFDHIYPSWKSLYDWLVEVKNDHFDSLKEDKFVKFLKTTIVCFETDPNKYRLVAGTMETSHRDVRSENSMSRV